MEREDIKMLVKKWWDIYNDKSLDYSFGSAASVEARNGTEQVNLQKSFKAALLSEAGDVQYVTAPSAA